MHLTKLRNVIWILFDKLHRCICYHIALALSSYIQALENYGKVASSILFYFICLKEGSNRLSKRKQKDSGCLNLPGNPKRCKALVVNLPSLIKKFYKKKTNKSVIDRYSFTSFKTSIFLNICTLSFLFIFFIIYLFRFLPSIFYLLFILFH